MSELKVKWPKVLNYNNLDERPIVQWIDLGNATMFRIGAFFVHGGRKYPRIGLFVGIERVGSFFFRIPEQPISGAYVSEKLFLPPADANIMADWLNAQFGFVDAKQQGDYIKHYIEEVDEYHYSGENPLKPLCPIIIEE
jgi:hypothetical protein